MTMLEKAAVALLNRQRNRYGLSSVDVGMFDVEEVERAKDLARAVLMAVREATNSQYVSGHDDLHSKDGCLFSAYTSMIDAILNEDNHP